MPQRGWVPNLLCTDRALARLANLPDNNPFQKVSPMNSRIGYLAAFCLTGGLILTFWFAGIGQGVSGDKAPTPGSITVLHDIQYRKGASKPWRLDLAMKKDLRGKPRPGIVVIHGGGWLEGDRSSFASRKHGVP